MKHKELVKIAVSSLLIVLSGSLHAESVQQDDMLDAFKDVMGEWEAASKITLCFDQARLMMFGAYQNEKGRNIDTFVSSGVLPVDSSEYGFVADGYKMDGFMDNKAKDYFLGCIKPVVYGSE